MVRFEFRPPSRLLFGEGVLASVGTAIAEFGQKALIVTGRRAMQSTGRLDQVRELLADAGVQSVVFAEASPNPTVEDTDRGAALAGREGCDVVLGLGGGSAMDTAKGIAVAAAHDRPTRDFMVATDGQPLVPTSATLPVICATSTAGTSSELTPFAVLTIPDLHQKSAIRSPFVLPRVAIEDPELTYTASPEITAATGVDVLCHAMESYISTKAMPLTDLMSQEAIRLVGQVLPGACRDGQEVVGRRQMMLANTFAGYGLATCGASVMHAVEHPVSAYYPEVAHGGGLAAMIRPWARMFWPEMPDRFARIAELLGWDVKGLSAEEAAKQAEPALGGLLQAVGLDLRLRDLGVDEELLPQMAEDACRYMGGAVSNTPGNPDVATVTTLLEMAY